MKINFACAQIEIIAGRPDENTKAALKAIQEAKEKHIDVLLLPELVIPGYLLGDLWEQTSFLLDCQKYGEEIIAATTDICVIFGNIALDKEKVNEDGRFRKYNAAFIAQNGKLIKGALPYPFIIKTSLPDYREFDDSRYFYNLIKLQPEITPHKTMEELVQPIEVTIKGTTIKLGVMICEDGWTENYHYNVPKMLVNNGAEILCNISCSPFTLNKNDKRNRVFTKQAKALNVPLLYCNNIGIQNNGKNIFTYDGSSAVYSKDGVVLADSPMYQEYFLEAIFNKEDKSIVAKGSTRTDESSIVDIYQALSYGATKFFQSLKINKITIGLSGGIDSAVAAALYVKILGPENVLLVNMPSQFNSDTTKNLAEKMAKNLGANYTIMPIENSVKATIDELTTTPVVFYQDNSKYTLNVSPLATENLQARDRGARVIAGLASCFGGVFSCNSNKAEITVGYATFYGDLAGALAILGDLWKHQVYALGHYLNSEIYKKEVIPEEVFTIKPSAELSSAQTVGCGGDPLIYPYHDYLFKAFVETWNKISPEDILDWYSEGVLEEKLGCEKGLIKKYFPTTESFIIDLERWWNLFCGFAVAKRIQAPPILSISKRSYGYDHREAQLSPYYSRRYLELKQTLMDK